mmetsp:Transcript_42458/g.112135  ORF Transcript_42458/g.112135 Transcript_42458/m.112135 type:complete len:201 (+) Transcript_42458:1693-2295(+)
MPRDAASTGRSESERRSSQPPSSRPTASTAPSGEKASALEGTGSGRIAIITWRLRSHSRRVASAAAEAAVGAVGCVARPRTPPGQPGPLHGLCPWSNISSERPSRARATTSPLDVERSARPALSTEMERTTGASPRKASGLPHSSAIAANGWRRSMVPSDRSASPHLRILPPLPALSSSSGSLAAAATAGGACARVRTGP